MNKLYGVWWFPTAVRIRLSQPPAGDWLVGAWAELGNKVSNIKYQISIIDYQILIINNQVSSTNYPLSSIKY